MRHGESLNEHCVHLLREERARYGENKQVQRFLGGHALPENVDLRRNKGIV